MLPTTFATSWDIVKLWVVQSTSQLTLISKSTSDPLYFPHFPIELSLKSAFYPTFPAPSTHPPQTWSHLPIADLDNFRSKGPFEARIYYINTHGFFRGDIELRWAPGRPFFHKGAELRRTSMDRLA